jgi:ABC-type sulfate/molybdate transport systems ATPase subunit
LPGVNRIIGRTTAALALARAIVAEPRVLLFDEPLSNLDSELRESLVRRWPHCCANSGRPPAHDRREAEILADRIVHLSAGSVAADRLISSSGSLHESHNVREKRSSAMALSSVMMSSAHALTVYTAGPGSLAKNLAAGFEKENRRESGYFQATTGKVMASGSRREPQADILISASWDTAEDLHTRGWLLRQSANAEKVPADLKSADFVAQRSSLGSSGTPKAGRPSRKSGKI